MSNYQPFKPVENTPVSAEQAFKQPNSTVEWALYYATVRNWAVFPVTINVDPTTGKKKPIFLTSWGKNATKDPEQIATWWTVDYPNAGIGIATGGEERLLVVDVDNVGQWNLLCNQFGFQPQTYSVTTRSGAKHYYFRAPEGFEGGSGILTDKADDGSGRFSAIEIRDEGYCVFAEPTVVLEGQNVVGSYHVDNIQAVIQDAPEWLIDMYRTKSGGKKTAKASKPVPTSEWPSTWDPQATQEHLDRILTWAEEEFIDIQRAGWAKHWDNEVTRVMGTLVRVVNSPWFEFEDEDLDTFLRQYAPTDENFDEPAHQRIKNSMMRSVDGDVILPDQTDYIDPEFLAQMQTMFSERQAERTATSPVEATETQEATMTPTAAPEAPVAPQKAVERSTSGVVMLPNIPDSFWNARPVYREIRRAAHARYQSADAALHAYLAAYASEIPWQYEVETGINSPARLCYFVANVGPSGAGKGGSVKVGNQLAGVEMGATPSSGEGIIEYFMGERVDITNPDNWDKNGEPKKNPPVERYQEKHNALFYFDEGSVLKQLADRSGATLEVVLLSLGTGDQLSTLNATSERKRHVTGGTYNAGLVANFQIETSGHLLSQGSTGLTQRFTWTSALDRNITRGVVASAISAKKPGYINPDHEMKHAIHVDPEIVAKLEEDRYLVATGQKAINPLDSHKPVKMLQTAGILRMIDGMNYNMNTGYMITKEDWALAEILYQTSTEVRTALLALVKEAEDRALDEAGVANAKRFVAQDAAITSTVSVNCRNKIVEILTKNKAGLKAGSFGAKLSTAQRKVHKDVLSAMVEDGTLVLEEDVLRLAS